MFGKLGSNTFGSTNLAYKRGRQRKLLISVLSPVRTPQVLPQAPAKEESMLRDIRKVKNAEVMLNRMLVISGASLGFAIVGTFFYPPVAVLSAPMIILLLIQQWKEAYRALKEGKLNVAFLTSFTMLTCLVMGYTIPGNLLGFVFFISRKLLLSVRGQSQKEFIDVFTQQPNTVWTLVDGLEIETRLEDLSKEAIVVVHTGEMIPVDGKVVAGIASVDQRILTGEAQPAEKEVGDQVFASTVVLAGTLQLEVEKAGDETTVAQIGAILNKTVDMKSAVQLRSEALADRTVIPFLIAGGVTLPILGPMAAISVINSHIGFRMSAVAPIGILTFLRILSQKGILVKDGRVLDRLPQVDTVVFDKTGTLTMELPHVRAIHCCRAYTEDEILVYAATAEGRQRHPIAIAIVEEAQRRHLPLSAVDEAQYEVGYGIKVRMEQRLVRVGSSRFMAKEAIVLPQEIHAIQATCHQQGHSLVIVAVNDEVVGALELQPTLRPNAREIVQGLRERGVKATYIISGDHEAPTRKLANELGVDHYFAETLPQNKAELIEQLQAEGKTICYIGDGINDSIALTKAEVSISLSGASTVAQDAAQIILLSGGLDELCELFDIAREYETNMQRNFWAVIGPCVLCVGGVYFANFGLITTIILKQFGLFTGIASALAPLRSHRNELVLSRNRLTTQQADNPE
ncbi:MAG: heavy metal translocating P-type ATPase [Caldilineaceae bacterium]